MLASSAPGLSSSTPAGNAAPNGRVNQLLHTLRGEHFRRALNAERVRLARTAAANASGPTHPPLVPSFSDPALAPSQFLPQAKPTPGPPAPRSWLHTRRQEQQDRADSAAWRASALELAFAPPRRDTLVQMCLEIILAQEPDVVLEILPELPAHLRRQAILHTAVHAPLSADGVRALGAVGGELVLARSYGANFLQRAGLLGAPAAAAAPTRDWDADEPAFAPDAEEPQPLHTLVLLTCPLAPAALSLLPATLTRLALLALPAPLVGLHRLPALLPLLTFLDLSLNPWMLERLPGRNERPIDRVQWGRWRQLEVLGLRQCGFDEEFAAEVEKKVQHGRLRDVAVYL
ncbi:hypothetical protein AURDEDRAFT_168393 [Auricularia subglabra TFB-10046 SS5]|nr:hypothetical protein AURDEDRAFT_168393 [Auricularia subglabra TFB-10046 SS5]